MADLVVSFDVFCRSLARLEFLRDTGSEAVRVDALFPFSLAASTVTLISCLCIHRTDNSSGDGRWVDSVANRRD